MKLSQLETDKALDVLCGITPYINNIVVDEDLLNELKTKVKASGLETKAEIMLMGAEKMNKLIPIVLKNHKNDVLGILAMVNNVDIEQMANQNIIKTMVQIRDLLKDKEFVDFFKSCVDMEKSE